MARRAKNIVSTPEVETNTSDGTEPISTPANESIKLEVTEPVHEIPVAIEEPKVTQENVQIKTEIESIDSTILVKEEPSQSTRDTATINDVPVYQNNDGGFPAYGKVVVDASGGLNKSFDITKLITTVKYISSPVHIYGSIVKYYTHNKYAYMSISKYKTDGKLIEVTSKSEFENAIKECDVYYGCKSEFSDLAISLKKHVIIF